MSSSEDKNGKGGNKRPLSPDENSSRLEANKATKLEPAAQEEEQINSEIIGNENEPALQNLVAVSSSTPAHVVLSLVQTEENFNELMLLRPRFDPFGAGFGGNGDGNNNPNTVTEPIDPQINFNVLGGLDDEIDMLRKTILLPFAMNKQKSDSFAHLIMKPAKGIIFYGSPGTGKTMLAKALAYELSQVHGKNINFYMRRGTDLTSKYVGESERNMRQLFAAAELNKPSLIFFDEMDGICPVRKDEHQPWVIGQITQFLGLVDKAPRGEIFIIGATNRLEAIDPAAQRPGRFDKKIFFSLPNEEGREHILSINLEKWGSHKPTEALIKELARTTPGFTGADLEQLIRNAVEISIQRTLPNLSKSTSKGILASAGNLTKLEVTEEDWKQSLRMTANSNSNVFGNAIYNGAVTPQSVHALINGIVTEIRTKIDAFSNLFDSKIEGHGFKSILVSGVSNESLESGDRIVIPSLISDLDESCCFLLKETKGVTNCSQVLNQVLKAAQDKTGLIFIPRIDILWLRLTELKIQAEFEELLFGTRGKNIVILATSACSSTLFPTKLGIFFQSPECDYKLRVPTALERRDFFNLSIYNPTVRTFSYFEKNPKNLQTAINQAVEATDNKEILKILSVQSSLALVFSKHKECSINEKIGTEILQEMTQVLAKIN